MRSASGLTVEFDADTHTYRVNGEVWPSVTQVLGQLQDFSMVDPDVLARAAAFGTNVHDACHLDNMGMLDDAALDPSLRPYVDAWRQFIKDSGAVVISSEHRIAHPKLRYAGTLDTVAVIRRRTTLLDIKSGSTVPRIVGPQTSAYAAAYDGPRIKDRLCVHLDGGTYKSIPLRDPRDLSIFQSALNLHYWRQNNG